MSKPTNETLPKQAADAAAAFTQVVDGHVIDKLTGIPSLGSIGISLTDSNAPATTQTAIKETVLGL